MIQQESKLGLTERKRSFSGNFQQQKKLNRQEELVKLLLTES